MKICLVRPKDERSSDVLSFPVLESLAIGYLAAALREAGHRVRVLDEDVYDLEREVTISRILKYDPNLIGFTTTAREQLISTPNIIKMLRKKGLDSHITCGGHVATFLYKDILRTGYFDSVVRGEGENTIVELANALENEDNPNFVKGLSYKTERKICINENHPLTNDLDDLPFPARDTLQKVLKRGGYALISSSRGCFKNCSYCSIRKFYADSGSRIFRWRSAENVLEELQQLKDNFKISEIWFVDDNFIFPGKIGKERVVTLSKGIKKLDLEFDIYCRADNIDEGMLKIMKKSGLRNVFIGVESGVQRVLDDVYKKSVSLSQIKKAVNLCKINKLSIDPGFIMFNPWSTMDEIEKNIKFLEDINEYTLYGICSFLTPYVFTPIGEEMTSGKRVYKKPRSEQKIEFLDFVPYEIADEKAEILLTLMIESFQEFAPLPRALASLKVYKRKIQEKNSKIANLLEAEFCRVRKEMNREGMRQFKRLFGFIKNVDIDDEGEILSFLKIVKKEVRNYTEEKVRQINELMK